MCVCVFVCVGGEGTSYYQFWYSRALMADVIRHCPRHGRCRFPGGTTESEAIRRPHKTAAAAMKRAKFKLAGGPVRSCVGGAIRCTVRCGAVLHGAVRCSAVRCGAVQRGAVRCSAARWHEVVGWQ